MYREIRVFFEKLEKEVAADEESRPSYDELGQFPYVEQVGSNSRSVETE
jgi:hypothetical protein